MILSVFVLSCYILPGAYANSEFYVSNTKGSYNLGCELDKSCFEPSIKTVSTCVISSSGSLSQIVKSAS